MKLDKNNLVSVCELTTAEGVVKLNIVFKLVTRVQLHGFLITPAGNSEAMRFVSHITYIGATVMQMDKDTIWKTQSSEADNG